MESLLACYASDDEEDDRAPVASKPSISLPEPSIGNGDQGRSLFSSVSEGNGGQGRSGKSMFSSLPEPSIGNSLFSSLPEPSIGNGGQGRGLFRSLPEPSIGNGGQGRGLFSSLPAPKKNKAIDFRPSIDAASLEEEEDSGTKQKKQRSEGEMIVVGRLVLPAPKNSLGIGGALGGGSSRRGQALDLSNHDSVEKKIDEQPDGAGEIPWSKENHSQQSYESSSQEVSYQEQYYEDPYQGYQTQGYENYESQAQENVYHGYENQAQEDIYHGYENQQENSFQYYDPQAVENQQHQEEDPVAKALRQEKRRGRDEPVKFVEIKQSDLTANRPREDQLRMTGIAFGSTFSAGLETKEEEENKPSKLHKRKHQIGSLYYEMKQKEFELMERRARGQLSKSQTQAKYGW